MALNSSNFSKRQWLTLIVFAIADFCSAVCVSLQAPFYPQEAEEKGATATEYGLVFGVFELTVFIVSPLLGKNLRRLGAKRVFNLGILTTGSCSVLFGVLDRIPSGRWFIITSIIVRSVEAVGNSGFLTATFSIIAKEFPDRVATMFASLETFFGIGLIVGPSVGGALYQMGGYTLPFVVLGSILIKVAIITYFVLPNEYNDSEVMSAGTNANGGGGVKMGLMDACKVPSIAIAAYSIICAAISIGFIQTTLEPHMRQFDLSPIMMGVMFVINGGVYAFSAPIWGYMCDKRLPGKLVTAIGAVFISISFLFLGPVPFIPLETSFGLCIGSLVLHAIGFAAQLVAGFSVAHREAILNGFPDNLDTYALISGLWTSTFAFGAFVGPSIAGALVDKFQFPSASLLVIASQLTVLIMSLCVFAYHLKQRKGSGRSGLSDEDYEDVSGLQSEDDSLQGSYYGSQDKRGEREPSLGYETLSSGEASEEEKLLIGGNGAGKNGGGGTGKRVAREGREGNGGGRGLRQRSVQSKAASVTKSKAIFSPMASPLGGLGAGVTGVSLAVEYQNCLSDMDCYDSLLESASAAAEANATPNSRRMMQGSITRSHKEDGVGSYLSNTTTANGGGGNANNTITVTAIVEKPARWENAVGINDHVIF